MKTDLTSLWASVPLCLCVTFGSAGAQAADRIILRNLDIITDRTVTALDEDGLVLDAPRSGGSNRLTWDEIERGRIALDQPRFDALLSELGPQLYRIRQRLKIGDYAAAGQPAETLYPRFADRSSQTAYLVAQATMWSRIAAGQRESAVEPYLRCYELLRSRAATSTALPGSRRLKTDAITAISAELAPVWFGPAAAKAALAPVQQVIRAMAQPRPAGAYVYYATLAAAAGDSAEVDRVLPLISGLNGADLWPAIVRAEQELAGDLAGPHKPEAQARGSVVFEQLRSYEGALPTLARPTALLLLGLADIRSTEEEISRSGLLSLLTLPAVYGTEQPELAAAGLYHAAHALDKLKDSDGAAVVRRELTSRYAGTHFGAMSR